MEKTTKALKKKRGEHFIDDELVMLLSEIENEPVPERLLELASKLQEALAGRKPRQDKPH